MSGQAVLRGAGRAAELIKKLNLKKPFAVHGGSYRNLSVKTEIENSGADIVFFENAGPNPVYSDVCRAAAMFVDNDCDSIIAVGGGSVIDTAKCVKLFCLDGSGANFEIPFIAVPTTAGSGSESTSFAVVYHNGGKLSLGHERILPDYAVLMPELLKTLPVYQKKCAFLDALCQGIESWWSVNSTEESRVFSQKAVETFTREMRGYFAGHEPSAETVMDGANLAGRAINITQTTAPHAMSYKLTSLYGLPHGHAAALCLPEVWRYMFENTEKTVDSRGREHLLSTFSDITKSLGYSTIAQAISGFSSMLKDIGIFLPGGIKKDDISALSASVNPVRLKNSPVAIDEAAIKLLYTRILEG